MASVSMEFILLATVTNVYAADCFYEYTYYNTDGEIKYHSDYVNCGTQYCCNYRYLYCCSHEQKEVNLNAVIFGSIFGVTILFVCCGVILRCRYKKSQQPASLTQNRSQNGPPGEANPTEPSVNIFALPPPSYEECVIKRTDVTEAATYDKDLTSSLQESAITQDRLPEYKDLASLGIIERPTDSSSTNTPDSDTPTVTSDNNSHPISAVQATYL